MIEFMNCEQFALLYWKEREREKIYLSWENEEHVCGQTSW